MSEEILSPPPSRLLSPMSLLHHLSAFRVLVCKAPTCKHALRPGGIADYLLGKHKISSKMRKPFLDYTATLDIVGPEDVQNPENGSFWIQELCLCICDRENVTFSRLHQSKPRSHSPVKPGNHAPQVARKGNLFSVLLATLTPSSV